MKDLTTRQLSIQDYNAYLDKKTKMRNIHMNLKLLMNLNSFNSNEYYMPRYSDMLLFGLAPDKTMIFSDEMINNQMWRD